MFKNKQNLSKFIRKDMLKLIKPCKIKIKKFPTKILEKIRMKNN